MTNATAEATLQLSCPSCRAPMRVRTSAVGKRVACPKCRATTLVERPAVADTDDVACPACGGVTPVPRDYTGSIRCGACMMPLPGKSKPTRGSAFLDVLPFVVAALLMGLSVWSLGVLVPAVFGTVMPGLPRAVYGTFALINIVVAASSLAYLMRMDAGRIALAWLLAIGCVMGLVSSVAAFSPYGLVTALVYGLASMLFFSGHGEVYVSGGSPGPKTARTLTAVIMVAALIGGGFSYSRVSRGDDFKKTLDAMEAKLGPVRDAVTAASRGPKENRTALIRSALKACDDAEAQLSGDRFAVLRARVVLASMRLRAIGAATEPIAEADAVRQSARALVAEVRSAVAGSADPMAKLASSEAGRLER